MPLKQYPLVCLARASYLVVDEAAGMAAIVAPQRDIDPCLQDASQLGLDIRYIFLTHFRADFHAGESPERGQVHLDLLEPPGRTPEAICIVVTDLQHDPGHPQGDTWLIGDVGRPDVMDGLAAWEAMGLGLEVTDMT